MEKPAKGIKKRILLLAGFLAGLSIAFYPMISSRWNAYRESRLVTDYTQSVLNQTTEDEREALIEDAREYNRTLHVPSVPDAFSIRDGIEDQAYEALLSTDDEGMIGHIEIPAIHVNLPIYHYTTEESLLKGAGHLFGSALPVGGEGTHCVVSAHRGLPSAKMFTDLNLLKEGDTFYFHVLDQVFAYEVDQILTVEPSEVTALSVTEGEDLATLVTCTPYAINTQRLLVRGHRIPYTEETYTARKAEEQKVARTDDHYIMMQILCVAAGIAIAVVIMLLGELIQRKRNPG